MRRQCRHCQTQQPRFLMWLVNNQVIHPRAELYFLLGTKKWGGGQAETFSQSLQGI